MSAAKQFYEVARSRVSELIAAAEKSPRPAKTTGHNGIPFAVASIVLTAVAEFFAFLRVSHHTEWTFVAALVIGAALPLMALGRASILCFSGGSRAAYAAVFSSGEAVLAIVAAVFSLFPTELFDGIGVQAASMFAFAAMFAGASSSMACISMQRAVAHPPHAEELMRELDSAVACYDTDAELGEFSTLHRFREKLSSLEAHYRML